MIIAMRSRRAGAVDTRLLLAVVLLNLALFILSNLKVIPLGTGLVVRINLASAGVWWLLWSLWTWATLQTRHTVRALPPNESVLGVAFKQLSETMETPAHVIAALLLSGSPSVKERKRVAKELLEYNLFGLLAR